MNSQPGYTKRGEPLAGRLARTRHDRLVGPAIVEQGGRDTGHDVAAEGVVVRAADDTNASRGGAHQHVVRRRHATAPEADHGQDDGRATSQMASDSRPSSGNWGWTFSASA